MYVPWVEGCWKTGSVLNSMIEDLNRKELHPERLRELLGHTPSKLLSVQLWDLDCPLAHVMKAQEDSVPFANYGSVWGSGST